MRTSELDMYYGVVWKATAEVEFFRPRRLRHKDGCLSSRESGMELVLAIAGNLFSKGGDAITLRSLLSDCRMATLFADCLAFHVLIVPWLSHKVKPIVAIFMRYGGYLAIYFIRLYPDWLTVSFTRVRAPRLLSGRTPRRPLQSPAGTEGKL